MIEVTKGQLEIQIQTVTQAKEVIQGESPQEGACCISHDVNSQEGNGKLSSARLRASEWKLLMGWGAGRLLLGKRMGQSLRDVLVWHLGEVKCLKLELDAERSRAEQERDAVARQLAHAEQDGHAALERQKVAHEEEVNRLQEKWVGGGVAGD